MAQFYDTPNSYPEDWTAHERDFFDSEPNNLRGLYDADEWRELQEAFETGWLVTGISREEHESGYYGTDGEFHVGRDRWFDITGVTEGSFEWQSYREYILTYVSPDL